MPRTARHAPKGYIYHAFNRAVARLRLFRNDADYEAFERVIAEAHDRVPLDIFAYCLMPDHWHFVLRPTKTGQLTAFLRWMTHTHAMRRHAQLHTSGSGHLYQGRFKAFPLDDDHFCTVVRYVERNAVRARLVRKAENWRWSSLARYVHGDAAARSLLARWPVPRPRDWVNQVNAPVPDAELAAVRRSVQRGRPFGGPAWQLATAKRLGLEFTLRPRGRPKKQP